MPLNMAIIIPNFLTHVFLFTIDCQGKHNTKTKNNRHCLCIGSGENNAAIKALIAISAHTASDTDDTHFCFVVASYPVTQVTHFVCKKGRNKNPAKAADYHGIYGAGKCFHSHVRGSQGTSDSRGGPISGRKLKVDSANIG